MSHPEPLWAEELETARAALRAAGDLVLPMFRQAIAVDNKNQNDFDPVTAADRDAERLIRRELEREFPDDAILGEEEGERSGRSGRTWILDPIDGTRAFVAGFPLWGMLLGLEVDDRPVLGLMHQPFLGETFSGVAGAGGSYERRIGDVVVERPLAGSKVGDLAEATLSSTTPELFGTPRTSDAFARLCSATRMTRYGSDCYAYCLLALGTVDLVVEEGLKAVDIAPLIPIIEAAGGVVTSETGGSAAQGGFVVAAANPALHRQALALLDL